MYSLENNTFHTAVDTHAANSCRLTGETFASMFTGQRSITLDLSILYQYRQHIVASDGHIMVGVQDSNYQQYPKCPDLMKSWLDKMIEYDGNFLDIPNFDLPPRKKHKCIACEGSGTVTACKECDGEGALEFITPYNVYEIECATCNGSGRISGGSEVCEACEGDGFILDDTPFPIKLYQHTINGYLLNKLIALRPETKVASHVRDYSFIFQFDDGRAMIMGMWT